jgi:hypothetical protein
MGRRARQGGVVVLAAILAAGAVVGTVEAERATVGHVVPGLGQYAGGRYCITQTPPFETTTTPDTATVWTKLDDGTILGPSTYNLHDSAQATDLRVGFDRVVKLEECWEGK